MALINSSSVGERGGWGHLYMVSVVVAQPSQSHLNQLSSGQVRSGNLISPGELRLLCGTQLVVDVSFLLLWWCVTVLSLPFTCILTHFIGTNSCLPLWMSRMHLHITFPPCLPPCLCFLCFLQKPLLLSLPCHSLDLSAHISDIDPVLSLFMLKYFS